jgi:hypothetical protein
VFIFGETGEGDRAIGGEIGWREEVGMGSFRLVWVGEVDEDDVGRIGEDCLGCRDCEILRGGGNRAMGDVIAERDGWGNDSCGVPSL